MTKEDEAQIREAAAAEWDATVPRWNMPRERFIEWHVWCANQPKRRATKPQ